MVELSGAWDYIGLFALAMALGAVGGLAFELLQTHRGQTGWVEVPRKVQGGRYKDWGVFANVVIGAIAAVAALWVFPPQVIVDAAGKTTSTSYDVVKVVGLSLIVGSAGSSFLAAMQARALALVKDQQAKQTTHVAEAQFDTLQTSAKSGASHEQMLAQLESAKAAVRSVADSGPGNPDFV